ncbi:MAG: chromosome segregation protein SMC [Chitinophagales bacterium]|nr:chromosome segregation protein SMC [Chitinophagales bacterium]
MRLKSIEIKGFKSFADKTIINFDQNITGIVGPNGCGKSNIVDAVRWVLGEQKSKSLRLEKMDNIIFNGTKERHPSNIAEVSMTLDNTKNILSTEYSSVTITRTITREGDSEYRLNGIVCRLKDIRDLFLDTGISTDTYAIIELKMIDDILNDVDKARRRLLEQASGISKYKTRKKETLLKLQGTESDLDRVEDILHEINKNLKGLESQAKKAKQYKGLKEEYKLLAVDIASYELMEINQICDDKLSAIQNKEDQIVQDDTLIRTNEAQLEVVKQAIIDGEKLLSDEQKKLNQLVNTIQEYENEKKLLLQQATFQQNKTKQIEESNIDAEQSIEKLAIEINAMENSIGLAETQMLELKKLLNESQTVLDEKREKNLILRERFESAESQLQQLKQKIFSTEKDIAIKQTELDGQIKSAQQSLFENEERQKQLSLIESEMNGLEDKINKHTVLLNDIERKEAENNEKIEQLESKTEEYRTQLNQINRSGDAKNNEFKLTKNMVDSLQGFPDAIKHLKKNAPWLKDALLVTDILYCEEKYRAAVEIVLQPFLNHFVVQTEAEAIKSIKALQDGGNGKAGFFILDYFASISPYQDFALLSSDLTPVYNLLEIDKAYQPLLSYLLKEIYLVSDDFQFDKWEKPNNFNGEIVTQSGHILKSSYQISGGSVGLFEGKRLGRLKNLEKLEKEIKELDQQSLGLKKSLQETQFALQECKNHSYKKTIERERKDLSELEKSYVSKKTRIENFKEVVEVNKERQANVQQHIERLKNEILPLKSQLDDNNESWKLNSEQTKTIEENYKKESEKFGQLQQHFNENNIRFIQQENLYKSLLQNKQYKINQSNSFKEQSQKYNENLIDIQKELQEISNKTDKLEQLLILEHERKQQLMSALSNKESNFFEIKQSARNLEDSIRDIEKKRRITQESIIRLKEDYNEQKIRLNVLKEKLAFEFRIELESLLEDLKEPETSKDILEEKMIKIRRKLDQFGEVNPMAEEAYDEMKERFDFISEQKKDLVDAKVSLLATINEVDTIAKEQFLNTFTAVRENFIRVFRSMFTNDDTCDLLIVNPDDVLESEIEITAKPKGKRPQSVNQLSGGEKTLTALSLLFALYLYKPAPFCILDEVDAPLDDNNIKKFNDAIREFSKSSQFILVTHNKSTMAEVDNIYGVTMIKQGISRVVPVDFSYLN